MEVENQNILRKNVKNNFRPVLSYCRVRYQNITYSCDYGETVYGRIDETPRATTAVRGRASFERVVKLCLELDQLPPGDLFPLVSAHPSAVRPQSVQKISFYPLHAALVERLECALGETEHQTAHSAHQNQYHLCYQ